MMMKSLLLLLQTALVLAAPVLSDLESAHSLHVAEADIDPLGKAAVRADRADAIPADLLSTLLVDDVPPRNGRPRGGRPRGGSNNDGLEARRRRLWQPRVGQKWQIVLDGVPDARKGLQPNDAAIWDVDLWDADREDIRAIKRAGKRVICYFSAGTLEDWRPDYKQLQPFAKGRVCKDEKCTQVWEGEQWIDPKSREVWKVMARRITLAKQKGCDAVDPDNMDFYDNSIKDASGKVSKYSANDSIRYLRFLADEAASRGMSIGLKNSLSLIPRVQGFVQFAVNEECTMFKECGSYRRFLDRKPVFHIEYTTNFTEVNGTKTYTTPAKDQKRFCNPGSSKKFSTIIKPGNSLSPYYLYCDGKAPGKTAIKENSESKLKGGKNGSNKDKGAVAAKPPTAAPPSGLPQAGASLTGAPAPGYAPAAPFPAGLVPVAPPLAGLPPLGPPQSAAPPGSAPPAAQPRPGPPPVGSLPADLTGASASGYAPVGPLPTGLVPVGPPPAGLPPPGPPQSAASPGIDPLAAKPPSGPPSVGNLPAGLLPLGPPPAGPVSANPPTSTNTSLLEPLPAPTAPPAVPPPPGPPPAGYPAGPSVGSSAGSPSVGLSPPAPRPAAGPYGQGIPSAAAPRPEPTFAGSIAPAAAPQAPISSSGPASGTMQAPRPQNLGPNGALPRPGSYGGSLPLAQSSGNPPPRPQGFSGSLPRPQGQGFGGSLPRPQSFGGSLPRPQGLGSTIPRPQELGLEGFGPRPQGQNSGGNTQQWQASVYEDTFPSLQGAQPRDLYSGATFRQAMEKAGSDALDGVDFSSPDDFVEKTEEELDASIDRWLCSPANNNCNGNPNQMDWYIPPPSAAAPRLGSGQPAAPSLQPNWEQTPAQDAGTIQWPDTDVSAPDFADDASLDADDGSFASATDWPPFNPDELIRINSTLTIKRGLPMYFRRKLTNGI